MADIYAKRVKAANKLALRKERADAKADRLAAKAARALQKSNAATNLVGEGFGALSYEDVTKIRKGVGLRSHSDAVALDQQLALRQRKADFAQLAHHYIDHFHDALEQDMRHDCAALQPVPPRALTVVIDVESVLAGRHNQSWASDPADLLVALTSFRAGAYFTEDDRLLLLLPDSLAASRGRKALRLPIGAAGISIVTQERLTDAVERLMAEERSSTIIGVTSDRRDAVQVVRQGASVMRSNRLVALVTEGCSAAGGRNTRADKSKAKHRRGGRGPRYSKMADECARM